MDLDCGGRISDLLVAQLPYDPCVVHFGSPLVQCVLGNIQTNYFLDPDVARQMRALRRCTGNLQGQFITTLIVFRQMFMLHAGIKSKCAQTNATMNGAELNGCSRSCELV